MYDLLTVLVVALCLDRTDGGAYLCQESLFGQDPSLVEAAVCRHIFCLCHHGSGLCLCLCLYHGHHTAYARRYLFLG